MARPEPTEEQAMSIQFPKLPYDYDALEPVISAATLRTHHGKHHRAYVDKVNALIPDTPVANESLEAVVKWAAGWRTNHTTAAAIFNNAAQAWNHAFYWESLRPRGGSTPQGKLAALIASGFGSHAGFAEALKSAATSHFGSGWAWLVLDSGVLTIVTTANADTPLVGGQLPLLVIDVWEHAYYLDHQERRAAYVAGVVDHLLDWDFAARNLERRGDGAVDARPDVTATAR
jgi:Fe-Mn family superoxide dismutase